MTVSLDKTPTTRRDIGAHIAEVFGTGVEIGAFYTASQIANVSTTEYGDSKPSTGAITARLFPQSGVCTVPGVRPASHPETGALGAMKVSEFEVDGVRWQTGPVAPQV